MSDNVLKKATFDQIPRIFFPVMIHLQSSHLCSVLNLSSLGTTNSISFLPHRLHGNQEVSGSLWI